MGYTFQEKVVGDPLTQGRQEWLKWVLEFYHVSPAGAAQFVGGQAMTDIKDRQQVLDLVNRVIVPGSGRPKPFRGKGRL